MTRKEWLKIWGFEDGTPEAAAAWPEGRDYPMPDALSRRNASRTHIIRDMEPFRSVVDGSIVSSRSVHRDHMRKHDLVEVGNDRLQRRETKLPSAGHDIKRHLDQVRSMPDRVYADRVAKVMEGHGG